MQDPDAGIRVSLASPPGRDGMVRTTSRVTLGGRTGSKRLGLRVQRWLGANVLAPKHEHRAYIGHIVGPQPTNEHRLTLSQCYRPKTLALGQWTDTTWPVLS